MPLLSKKICIIGELEVGKNSLICRFVERQFSDEYLVALNECDLIEQEKLEKLIELKNLEQASGIYSTSAKTGLYVDELFIQIGYKILESCGKGSPLLQTSPEKESCELNN